MSKIELKLCPFCGESRKKMIIASDGFGGYRPQHICASFYILGKKWWRTEEEAIDVWNRRANDVEGKRSDKDRQGGAQPYEV